MISQEKVNEINSDAFTEFYEKWAQPLRRALALTIGDLSIADEAIDEAMTRALERWSVVATYERPEGWVYRVGLNWARGTFRRRRYELVRDLASLGVLVEGAKPNVDLVDAVGRLPFSMRTVVIARYYLDWPTESVARSLRIPQGTVKSRLARGLKRLARDLGDEYEQA